MALGVVAGSSLIGPGFKLKDFRGQLAETEVGEWQGIVLATVHPSALLRAPDETARQSGYEAFVADLTLAREVAAA